MDAKPTFSPMVQIVVHAEPVAVVELTLLHHHAQREHAFLHAAVLGSHVMEIPLMDAKSMLMPMRATVVHAVGTAPPLAMLTQEALDAPLAFALSVA